MATVQEVELMNRGFDRMADTLLRKRMLEEQARERAMDRDQKRADRAQDQTFRERSLGLDERRVAASEKSAAASDEMRKLLLEDRKTQEAIGQVRNQINDVTQRHRAGQISTAQANAQIARLKTSIEQGTKLILKESGLADFTLQDIPREEKGQMETAGTRNLAKRLELEQAIARAKTPEEKLMAERALELWKEERGGAGGETERVTEYERDPETGDLLRSRTRSEKATAAPATGAAGKPGKPLTLDQAKQFLAKAGGDKAKARELARQAGFTF